MGKHEVGYARQGRDYYPTRERWVTEALLEHIDITDLTVWECATGSGDMAEVLKVSGAARVYCTDIADYGYPLDEMFDFTSTQNPSISIDAIITNPPGGPRNSTAEAFVEAGLRRITPRGFLALLLPADFDSAVTRRRFFADCPYFCAKIVLTRRIVWFERRDEERPAQREPCLVLLAVHTSPYLPSANDSIRAEATAPPQRRSRVLRSHVSPPATTCAVHHHTRCQWRPDADSQRTARR